MTKCFAVAWIIIFAALIGWLGSRYLRYKSPPEITIVNASGMTLERVIISGNGFEKQYQSIADGHKQRFSATVLGESAVNMVFSAGTQEVHKIGMGYIETHGGYRVNILVNTNLDVVFNERIL